MRILISFALLFAAAANVSAQMKPEAPKPNGKILWGQVALLGASQSADAITTRRLLNAGGKELNPIFGEHPSVGRQAGINAAIFAGHAFVLSRTERSRSPLIRWSARAYTMAVIVNHAQLAACNSRIDPRGTQRCHSFLPF